MFTDSGVLIMGKVEEFYYLIFIWKVRVICHTVELMVKLGLGLESTAVHGFKGVPGLENVSLWHPTTCFDLSYLHWELVGYHTG